jgi:rare lipoprotein A
MIRIVAAGAIAFCMLSLTGCSSVAKAKTDERDQSVLDTQIGYATFYARHFHGDKTASGIKLDNADAVAAHRVYPFCTVVRVTNLKNGRALNVAIVDRGPYGKNRREGAIIDLSRAAAQRLGMMRDGEVRVKLEVLLWGEREDTPESKADKAPKCGNR